MFSVAFLRLQLGFVIFWQKSIGAKVARKMLMKLTQDANDALNIALMAKRKLQHWAAHIKMKYMIVLHSLDVLFLPLGNHYVSLNGVGSVQLITIPSFKCSSLNRFAQVGFVYKMTDNAQVN